MNGRIETTSTTEYEPMENTAVKTDNKDLVPLYQRMYSDGTLRFTTSMSETSALLQKTDWTGKTVLEIGCGEGDLAAMIGIHRAAHVTAIDFAQSGIDTANAHYQLPNVEFRCCDFVDVEGRFDAIVMEGTIEHMDDPLSALKTMADDHLNRPGQIITSSPSFLNPRGYVWMALQLLLDVPMSLSDRHFLCPFDFERFAGEIGARMDYLSVDQDWGHGDRLIEDFDQRLRNALRDRGFEADVDRFLAWLKQTVEYGSYSEFSGANIVYELAFDR